MSVLSPEEVLCRLFYSIDALSTLEPSLREEYMSRPDFVLNAVRRRGCSLKFASTKLKRDKVIVLAANAQDKEALQFASRRLRSDPDFMFPLMKDRDDDSLGEVLTPRLASNKKFAIKCVSHYDSYLLNLIRFDRKQPPERQVHFDEDYDIVRAAVTKNWEVLNELPNFSADREILRICMKNNKTDKLPNCFTPAVLGDHSIVQELVASNGLMLQWIPDVFRRDVDVVMAAVKNNPTALRFAAPEVIVQQRDIVLEAVKGCGDLYSLLPSKVQWDRDVVLAAVASNADAMILCPNRSVRGDKAVALAACARNGLVLEHVSDELRGDTDVILCALKSKGAAIRFVPPQFIGDKTLWTEALRQDGSLIRIIPDVLLHDVELIAAVVSHNPSVFERLPEWRRHDPAIAMISAPSYGLALAFVTSEMKDNKAFVLRAVSATGTAVQFASERLRNDRDIALAAVNNDPEALRFVGADFRDDSDFAIRAVAKKGDLLALLSDRLKDDMNIVVKAVESSGSALQFASNRLRSCKDVVLSAVTQNFTFLRFADECLKSDLMFVQECQFARPLEAHEVVVDRDTCLREVQCDGYRLRFAKVAFQDDDEIVAQAVQQLPWALLLASPRLQSDAELVAIAVTQWRDSARLLSAVRTSSFGIQFIQSLVRKDKALFEHLDPKIRADITVVMNATSQFNTTQLRHAAPHIRDDPMVLETIDALTVPVEEMIWTLEEARGAIRRNWDSYTRLSPQLRKSKELALIAVEANGFALSKMTRRWQGDVDVVMTAVKQAPLAFTDAREPAVSDLWVTFHAALQNPSILEDMPLQFLASNIELVKALIILSDTAPMYVPKEILNDIRVAPLLAKVPDFVYQFLTKPLTLDKSFAMFAVGVDGCALQHLNPHLQGNADVVRAAVRGDARSFKFASDTLKANREFVLELINEGNKIFEFAASELRLDLALCVEAAAMDAHAMKAVDQSVATSEEFQTALEQRQRRVEDKTEILEMVRSNGLLLQRASYDLTLDEEVVLTAVRQHSAALAFAARDLFEDKKFLNALCSHDPMLIYSAASISAYQIVDQTNDELLAAPLLKLDDNPERCHILYRYPKLRRHKKLMLACIRKDVRYFKLADESLRDDVDICSCAVEADPEGSLWFVSENLRNSVAFMAPLIRKNVTLLRFAGPRVRQAKELMLATLSQHPEAIRFASTSLLRDADVLDAVCLSHPKYLELMEPDFLEGCRDFFLRLIQVTPPCSDEILMQHLPHVWRNDEQLVEALLHSHPKCVQDIVASVNGDLLADRTFMMRCVKRDGLMLRFASTELRSQDRGLVAAAVLNNRLALELALPPLKHELRINNDGLIINDNSDGAAATDEDEYVAELASNTPRSSTAVNNVNADGTRITSPLSFSANCERLVSPQPSTSPAPYSGPPSTLPHGPHTAAGTVSPSACSNDDERTQHPQDARRDVSSADKREPIQSEGSDKSRKARTEGDTADHSEGGGSSCCSVM